MNIQSGCGYPAGALSNFAPHPFTFRGIPVTSCEGFLQGLKFSSPEMQRVVFLLAGKAAKSKGARKKWRTTQTLYFQGQPIKRDSEEYQDLLDEMYEALFTQNESAKRALLATGGAVLTHSIGKSNASETVLTRSEFCTRLMNMRQKLAEV